MTPVSAEDLNVSRETFDRLQCYASLLEKWTLKINLISRSSVPFIWSRHIRDSLQVYRAGPDTFDSWVDLGSGGGLPGVVVAILAAESPAQKAVRLVESDGRKAAFLRTALRETAVPGSVICERIEALSPQNADVLSARALADLKTLLGFADRHLSPTGVALFSKGATWEKEVEEARQEWSFSCQAVESETEKGSVILKIGDIARV
ncbi:16S rRNA (guanine(527)-N(7))-methyltransferase RsmG [Seohaeicola saemankumensis]|uniref:Ribosomal RNA small subunit methyltransferase G n=1 Tax=Seohaeicola saemankumensis TaxID=481181 RepID=A0ABW3TD65_9RHOB